MIIPVSLGEHSYDILVENGCLQRAGELLNLDRKVLVVTDTGVPCEYAKTVAAQCKEAVIETFPQGEESKNMRTFEGLLEVMVEHHFSRKDCVVAVGGGVVGDLSGFAAACYMRGIDFYNIPTTVLSQVDSSIGGKTAIDFHGYKNLIGAFHQPKMVLVDPETLKTLPERQIANGLAEAAKMALTFDAEAFEVFEKEDPKTHLTKFIEDSLKIKRNVVEEDEKETGLRKVLNFGHTIGHGIESASEAMYHGECVAVGMIPMCSEEVRGRLIQVLKKLGLPVKCSVDPEAAYEALLHDKKSEAGGMVTVVRCEKVGSFTMEKVPAETLKAGILSVIEEA